MRAKPRFTLLSLVSLAAACQGDLVDDRTSSDSNVQEALSALPHAEVLEADARGLPRFVRGQLGTLDLLAPVFQLDVDDLRLERESVDDRGTHALYRRTFAGLDVIGGELGVHTGIDGTVYAVHGASRGGGDRSPTPSIDATAAADAALAWEQTGAIAGEPRLVFVLPDDGGDLRLAWEVRVIGEIDALPIDDLVYVAGDDASIVDLRPGVHSARDRRVYTASNGTSLPGSLRRSEGQAAVTDAVVNDAYVNTGTTYDCYATRFGRDSYNGAGARLTSTVHYDSRFNNAFWDGSQMVYGDGDGTQFSPLAGALDVTAHELTHAVTQYTAGLPYRNESGALNEAMSDIIGATCEAWARGGVSAETWMIGEDVTTPGTPGDALRYMDDPTADGYSYDYFPERYIGTWDYGGVHVNSGIANLAFKLLVTGGSHPRGKTTVTVPAIGLERASAIFYRALTVYMTTSTTFAGARAATVQAAIDLEGDATAQTVHKAWSAVGAPGAPTDPGGGGGGGGGSVLTSGSPVTGLGGATGSEARYTIDVPAGTTRLVVRISGGTGDADLYVRQGTAPTRTAYDYRPYLYGNEETVTVNAPAAGTWHIMVRGYTTYAGVSLVATR